MTAPADSRESTIKRLQDPETMRLHMGELTPSEVLVAQAAVRYAIAHQGRVVPVSVLEGLQAYYVSWNYQDLEPCEQNDPANETVVILCSDLRAIIEKGRCDG